MGGKVIELPEIRMIAEGEMKHLVSQVCRKLKKGEYTLRIADELDEDFNKINIICTTASKYAPEYNAEEVFKAVLERTEALNLK